MHLVCALDGLAVLCHSAQVIGHMDSSENEHLVVRLDLSFHFSRQLSIAGVDVARLQRASERAEQSASRRGDDVVDRRGMGLGYFRGHAIMLGDGAVDAEHRRLGFGR